MRAPILLYHWFDDGSGPASAAPEFGIDPALFRRQVDWLALSGRPVVSLGDVAAALRGGPALAPGAAVLTFDDGYDDFHDHALEALQRHGFSAIIFAVAGQVGKTNAWDAKRGEPARPLASFARLRELVDAGMEVGSHSVTHPDLRTLSDADLRAECEDSRRMLEDGLGSAVRHFAYPHGLHDARVRAAAQAAGYDTASAVLLRPQDLFRSDAFALMRAIIHGTRGMGSFRARLALAAPLHGVA